MVLRRGRALALAALVAAVAGCSESLVEHHRLADDPSVLDLPHLRRGERCEIVTSDGAAYRGAYETCERDSVVLALEGRADTWAFIAVDEIERIDVERVGYFVPLDVIFTVGWVGLLLVGLAFRNGVGGE